LIVPLKKDPPQDIVYSLEAILSFERARKKNIVAQSMKKVHTDLWLWPVVNFHGLNNIFKS